MNNKELIDNLIVELKKKKELTLKQVTSSTAAFLLITSGHINLKHALWEIIFMAYLVKNNGDTDKAIDDIINEANKVLFEALKKSLDQEITTGE